MMTRSTTLVVCMVFVLLCCSSATSATGKKRRLKKLVLYAHESRVPPSETLIVSASPSGNLTSEEFGVLKTVSNVLRASAAKDSTILGSQVGIVALGKGVLNVYLSFTYFLNRNSDHQGTIAVHGHIDAANPGDRIFAVVGGTGDFLSVTGSDTSPNDATVIDDSNVVNVHTLDLNYFSKYSS